MALYPRYQKYKQTKCAWLKEIPEHWDLKRIKNIATHNDEALDERTDPDFEIDYVDISSVTLTNGIEKIESMPFEKAPSRARRMVKDGDIIVSTVRTYLKAIAPIIEPPENMIVSTGFAVIRPKENLHSGYAGYLLQSNGFVGEVVANSVGVSYPAINASDLVRIPAVEPPLDEQQVIARFLDFKTTQIDALIAKKKVLLDKLAEKRTALISHAVTKGLDPQVEMKDSGVAWLGEIPAHWQRMLMVRVIYKFEQGWSPSCDEREASLDEWGVLKSGCVNYGVFQEREHKTLPPNIDPIHSLEVQAGDILMCRASGSKHLIGSVAMVRKCRPKLIFSDKTYRIGLNLDAIDPEFFILLMKSKYLRDQIELSISGADGLANNIPQSSVKWYQIVLPPTIDEQKAIFTLLRKKIEGVEAQEVKILEVIGRLQEYRSALITNAVTGKIDVRGFQIPSMSTAKESA
jgi:type I restriction enzyme S subunit